MRHFKGRKIRDEILTGLKPKIKQWAAGGRRPVLAVILIGTDPVSLNYVRLKQKIAGQIGLNFQLYHYPADVAETKILAQIDQLNQDDRIDGMMIQMPLPKQISRLKLIKTLSVQKDVDGLRYCAGLKSDFLPPVVGAIEKVIESAKINLSKSQVVMVGKGFLVGGPMARYLAGKPKKLVLADSKTKNLAEITSGADLIISATGRAGLIKPAMIKEGVVLIDAGTSEVGGKLKGDIDPAADLKSSYYTPVPGGIGPVTVAMLMKNLVKARLK